jgi:hypothetical protein
MLIEQPNQTTMNGNGNNLLAFIGGFIGAMTHYIYNLTILFDLKMNELFDFTVHSLIGGAIMLAVKVAGEWILIKIKIPRKRKPEDE